MATRDTIVIGASAGGVEALTELVRSLPGDLPATIFVVLHLSPDSRSVLPEILSRAGPLRAVHAKTGMTIKRGMIYTAPPDHHLILRDGITVLSRGPKENAHRPAVDPLFRSAAVNCGGRVIGIVLSGVLDDGAVGLKAIKNRAGIAIVQNPDEALFPDMPMSAMENSEVDYVGSVKEIAGLLGHLTLQEAPEAPPASREMELEDRIVAMDQIITTQREPPGHPSVFTCPECGGILFENQDGKMLRYRCRVGHAYSMETLAAEQSEGLEAAFWSAMVALKEKAAMSKRMAEFMSGRGHESAAARYNGEAEVARKQALSLQKILDMAHPLPANAQMAEARGPGEGVSGASQAPPSELDDDHEAKVSPDRSGAAHKSEGSPESSGVNEQSRAQKPSAGT